MSSRWLWALYPARERNQPGRRARSFVPQVEALEARDVPSTLLASGLQGGSGSTVGPGGALYVTEGAVGRVSRIDPRTGEVTTFASGLPTWIGAIGIGGAMDVAFLGNTAYVLVTLVGPDVGGSNVVGIYRVDGPNQFTVIADIGAFAQANPPQTDFFVPTGVQYALEPYRGGFLVTDGHHNRVLRVELDGEVTEQIAFGNIVPTGLAVRGNTVYMAEAGPIPHLPQTGKVVAFGRNSTTATEVASGAPLLVDVEFGPGRLYALSQGVWSDGPEGSPASPNTGALVRANADGSFAVIEAGLDRPTSLEFIGNTAYFVTLTGQVWKIVLPGGNGLTAAGAAGARTGAGPFADQELAPLVTEALARWRDAGADPGQLAGLAGTPIHVTDLPGTLLGQAGDGVIWIDQDAAGHGWFVDPTSSDDGEFATPGDQGEQGRMDLLTVLMHELGHLLGHDHDEGGVMAEALPPGARLLPGPHDSPGDEAGDGRHAAPPRDLARLLSSAPPVAALSLTPAGPGRQADAPTSLLSLPPVPVAAADEAPPAWKGAARLDAADWLFAQEGGPFAEPWEAALALTR